MATTTKIDRKHRYAPARVLCGAHECQVRRTVFHPPGTHTGPIVSTMGALELVTEHGSRWYGCELAYINAELRMVVVGFDARDEVRSTWPCVSKRNRV